MGVAEIVGFAVCWLVVASLMLWGVFTERHRGGLPLLDGTEMHPSRLGRPGPTDWIVVETAEGGSPEVAHHARFLASAWLASRGVDIDTLPPADLRTEVTSTGDGVATTRILVRAGALSPGRRSRKP
jgi:hypothetical protein